MRAAAGECLVTAAINPSRISVSQVDHSHLVCPLCKLVVNGPVQLACERLACAECVIQMLHSKGPSACCPSCGAPATSVHFMKCPSMVADLLGNLRVKCGQGCMPPFFSSPAAGEPPLCPDEQRVCTHLVKRALQESADLSTLILRTGGQVCCKDKQHACSYTVRTI